MLRRVAEAVRESALKRRTTMMRSLTCILAAAGLSACAATSDPQTADTTTVSQVDDQDEAQLICEYIRQTGTKFRRKVCGTKEQWEMSAARGQEAADAIHKSIKAQTAFDNPGNGT
jgi:hypothetical protein